MKREKFQHFDGGDEKKVYIKKKYHIIFPAPHDRMFCHSPLTFPACDAATRVRRR